MPSFRVEPAQLGALAGRFGELVADFEALAITGFDADETGDNGLTQAIEDFIEWSRAGVGEFSNQFSQVQRVLTAAALGYENVEGHVVDEITESLSPEIGPVGGSVEGD